MTPRQFLDAHPLLKHLSPTEATALVRQSVVKSFAARSTVFLRGDVGDGVYGVLSGSVSVTVQSAGGGDLILRLLESGELFGELAVLDNQGRTASVVARTPCTLLFIPRTTFLRVLARHPEVAAEVVPILAGYLRRNTRLVSEAAFLDVTGRLAKQLLELSGGRHAGEKHCSTIQVSQYELACMLGVSREIVNRHLTEWRRRGLVEMSRGRIRVVDSGAILELVQESMR